MPSIRIPFQVNGSGAVSAVSDAEKIIEQKIIDVLVTSRFERVMRPEYGSGAYDLLFEPVDELVYGEFRTDALSEINKNLTVGAVVDIRIAPVSQPLFNEDTSSTIEITAVYTTRSTGTRSFSFQIADTSLLTEETPI